MFTFSEMLALVQSESSFGAFVFHGRPAGLQATSDLVFSFFFFFFSFSVEQRKELSSLSSGSFRHMQPPSVTSHIHEHVDLHTSLILFLVPVSSGVEAAGRYRPGSPERIGWGRGWVAPTIRRRTRTRRRG